MGGNLVAWVASGSHGLQPGRMGCNRLAWVAIGLHGLQRGCRELRRLQRVAWVAVHGSVGFITIKRSWGLKYESAYELAGTLASKLAGKLAGELVGKLVGKLAGRLTGKLTGKLADRLAGKFGLVGSDLLQHAGESRAITVQAVIIQAITMHTHAHTHRP